MLEGINIISTEVTKDVGIPLFIFICAVACILMVCSIQLLKAIFEATKFTPYKVLKIIFNGLSIAILGFCLFFSFIIVSKALNDCFFNPVYNTKYIVTISDEVSYNEFTKKYEVLEYNEKDNTYVIREKENVD